MQQSYQPQWQQQQLWQQPCRAFTTQSSATASTDQERQKRLALAKAKQGRFYDTVKAAEVEGQVRTFLADFQSHANMWLPQDTNTAGWSALCLRDLFANGVGSYFD
jgi:hypothetical protein